jgi:hypothetical protein
MVFQYRPEWSGTTGGPGVSVINYRSPFGLDDHQGAADAIRAFFAAIAGQLPNEVSISFPDEVLELDTSTGVLQDAHPVTGGATVTGTQSTGYAMPAGVRVDWTTGAFVAGRRLRGRTYLVPIAGAAYDTNGTLTTTAINAIQTAANNFIAAMDTGGGSLGVWSRTHGILVDVNAGAVADEVAILRSRRD